METAKLLCLLFNCFAISEYFSVEVEAYRNVTGSRMDQYAELSRSKRAAINIGTICLKGQWQCRDTTCISLDDICDGLPHCPDSSDESHALCRNMKCPSNLFRCAYGACARAGAACNGFQDCADASDELIPRCRREPEEINYQYKCQNGQLIPGEKRCDGKSDCFDGSDETVRSCGSMECLPHLFQCAYGACVHQKADCDGKIDCADGSDETEELCGNTAVTINTTSRPASYPGSGECILPEHPANGVYELPGVRYPIPGQAFPSLLLKVICNTGYGLNGSASSYCSDGSWSGAMPQCIRQCKMNSRPNIRYDCFVYSDEVSGTRPCREYELEGTRARPTCADNYYTEDYSYAYCINGEWENLISCRPECGTVTPNAVGLMIGGNQAQRGELSWHAGIYDKTLSHRQICGGSLATNKVIISAAHCFWGEKNLLPAANYAVAVGKLYRSWNDRRDVDAQKRDVVDIKIRDEFRGRITNFQHDFALVFAKTPFFFTAYVRPVCVNFGEELYTRQLASGNLGKVAGWGLTSANGGASDELLVVELPYLDSATCIDTSPEHFQAHITSDKFCAGFNNGTALCSGDSGGGLSFPHNNGIVVRYYLRGVVSTAPANENLCNERAVTTFANVMVEKDFYFANVE